MKIPYLNRHLYVLWLKKPLPEKRLAAIRKGKAWIRRKVGPDLPEKEKTEYGEVCDMCLEGSHQG